MHSLHNKENGAALIEFIVIAMFVLVPMYLAVQALGKFADVRSVANNAARYAAWEKTVWHEETTSDFSKINTPNQKSTLSIHHEMLVRVFNDRAAGLKYTDSDKAATAFAKGTDPLWRDTAGTPLLSNSASIGLTAKYEKPTKDILGSAIGLINKIAVPSITGTLAPSVPSDTLAVVSFNLDKVGDKSEVYKRLWSKQAGLPADWVGLDYVASAAILSNTWASNAARGTKDMVAMSVPTAKGLGVAVTAATAVALLAWDPTQIPRLDMGRIAVDVVPADRHK